MKILFVVKSKMMENLGVMYLKSVAKAYHECKIVALPEAYDFAKQWAPDIVGLSVMTGDIDKFKALAERLDDKIKVIVGGPDPTFFPEGYMRWTDLIIGGEAEDTFRQVLEVDINHDDWWLAVHKNNKNQSPLVYQSIDDIPWPDRTDFPNMRVRDFISSRGCPYKCAYCYNAQWAELFPEQKGVRIRDVGDVIKEIKFVNPEYVYFQDSCFGVKMSWMEEFAKEYKEKISRPWQCNFRPEQITEERVSLLKLSGCTAVRVALESGVNRLRSLVGRHSVQLMKVREAAELLRENDIQLMLQNIIGLPTATIEDDLFTLECNIKYQPTYSWVSIFQPYPGTRLGDQCISEGWYKGDYSDISDSFFDTSYLQIDSLYKEQLEILQKIFAFCVSYKYLPIPDELTYKNLPKLIHKITRKDGDNKLYKGLLCM